jgi:acyl dehydratase
MAGLDQRWGIVDEQSIAEARELMGVPLRRDRMRWNNAATKDAIRQFALGVGDDNPLWGIDLAPPSFLYAIDATIVAPKLPGVQWIYAGTRWRWYDAIRVDDVFDVDARLTQMQEKQGRRFGLWVLQKGEIVFEREGGGLVCIAEGRVARTPRRSRPAKKQGTPTEPKVEVKVEESEVYQPEISTEPRRGNTPRLWESVRVGDTIGPVAIPLTLDGIFAWYTGAQGALHYGGAHGDGVRYRHRHDDFEINKKTGAKDSAARGHFSSKEGKDVGMGGAYDVGLQRIAWVIAILTDWIGDAAHLAEADIDVVAPNLVGDITYFEGEVVDSWHDENTFISIDLIGRNQAGRVTTKGRAVVALPSNEFGAVLLPLFNGDRNRWTATPATRTKD